MPGRRAYGKRSANRNDVTLPNQVSQGIVMTKKVRKAVFPVAGLGTRFLPATKAMPKEMLPIVDKPLIQYAVEEAQKAGIEEFIFVTGRAKSAIEDHFDHSVELEKVLRDRQRMESLSSVRDWMPPAGHICYTRQPAPLGLGHAVWCARNFVEDEPFAVLLADDLILSDSGCLSQMISAYAAVGGNMVAVEEVPNDQTDRYGILDVDVEDGRVASARGVVEKPAPADAPSNLAIIGRYVLDPSVLGILENLGQGAEGEIQLTDGLARSLAQDVPLHGYRFEGRRFDCGGKAGFLEANVAYALARDDLKDRVAEMLKRYA